MSSIEIWHNIFWSRYKGRVFGALHQLAEAEGEDVRFVQMAETETRRTELGPLDLSYHCYPYELIYRGPIDQLPAWRTVPRYFWRALTSRADFVVIAGYAEPQNWAQLASLMLRGTPRGVIADSTLHESQPGRLRRAAKRFFYRRADVVFHYGERAREMLLHFGARTDRLVRRRPAAALPDGYDVTAVLALRRAATPGSARFVYVGRLAPEKNLHRLLDAFAELHAERPEAKLRIIGDGPLRAELERRAGAGVVLLGALDQRATAADYLAATALVLPSLRKPWGMVVNEALSYGCPVIVSERCGCVPKLVTPGTGVAFDPLDQAALLAAMRQLADRPLPPEPCLAAIAPFTPERAAREILDGIRAALDRPA